MREAIARSMSKQSEALTVMSGDFNWVTCKEDRWAKDTGRFTGDSDATDEAHFDEVIARKFGMIELHQQLATCDSSAARSRLDRT